MQERTAEEARQPFDLEHGPLVRTSLYRLRPDEHVLLMVSSAIVMDDWSMRILLRELGTLYQAYSRGELSPLPELRVQVADYARWEREWIGERRMDSLRSYWLEQLPGMLTPIRLWDRPQGEVSDRSKTFTLELPDALAERIREYGREHGATSVVMALTGFKLLLHRYTGEEAVCVAVGTAQRGRVEAESLIGSFMNILLFRTDFSGSPTFGEALQRVRNVALGAFAHQEMPWTELVRTLREEGRLVDELPNRLMFDHLATSAGEVQEVAGLRVTPVTPELRQMVSGSDMCFRLQERQDAMAVTVFYKPDLFEDEAIRRLADDFRDLMQRGLENPSAPVSELLGTGER